MLGNLLLSYTPSPLNKFLNSVFKKGSSVFKKGSNVSQSLEAH
jgi:hypothetical protein